eukprot:gnl/TRDRNA2_/TRDRNA2_201695_c0_seq1.p1 gnl/TRDRNA2_/TRDRNA2_201695_c0~~gnl/TRDRNA2_/TRDRNA2_201695_c0_seq1.p1  ORF type:complete len:355 (+),score=49.66 gnl/TRDRNA2_/TRDRNA2_201695_c0_seq1:88-1152(+)
MAKVSDVSRADAPLVPSLPSISYDHEKLVRLGRRASKIHFEMILIPDITVATRLAPQLSAFFVESGRLCIQRFMIIASSCVVATLPWAYANFIMEYPCEPGKAKVGSQFKTITYRACDVEDTLRSDVGMLIGAALIGVAFILTVIMAIITKAMALGYESTGSEKWLEVNRRLWRPLLLFWYSWIGPKVPRLKYANVGNIIPCLYSPASVLVCFMYIVLVMEMMAIGYYKHHISVGLVLAYAMGEIFLALVNRIMAPGEQVPLIVNAHLRDWKPNSVLIKLHEVTQRGAYNLSLTTGDLAELEELAPKTDLNIVSDRVGADDTASGIGVIEKVYLTESLQMVDLVNGTVTRLGSS